MDKIQVKVLNPDSAREAEQMMVFTARLTQRGHEIKGMDDLEALYEKLYTEKTACTMSALPHPTIQKFGLINVAVVGASRRFLAQITRHQNEVKFMSASLQYSDYTGAGRFVIPYEILAGGTVVQEDYRWQCEESAAYYDGLRRDGVSSDTCGYLMPQALRGAVIISATPYQWRHMISQRVCKRNTDETRYVMLKIWEALYPLCHSIFQCGVCGPGCILGGCKEKKMSCGAPYTNWTISSMLRDSFPAIYGRAHES